MSRSRLRATLFGVPVLTALLCGCAALLGLEHHEVLEDGGGGGDAGMMSGVDAGSASGASGAGVGGSDSGGSGTSGGAPCSSASDCPNAKGDCMAPVCQDSMCIMVVDAADANDADECTLDVCNGVSPAHTVTEGTSCSQGGVCNDAGQCVACIGDEQCDGGICDAEVCTLPPCGNGVKDGTETDVDCGGGTCPKCPDGKTCAADADCINGTCGPMTKVCQ